MYALHVVADSARWGREASGCQIPVPLPVYRLLSTVYLVSGEAIRRFPEPGFNDRETMIGGEIVNQLGDILGRRVGIHQEHWFAKLFQYGDRRIIAVQDHAMIEIVVDPTADHALDVAEIEHHAAMIKLLGLNDNHRPAVVAVQVTALSLVVQQSMAVTE